MDVIQGAVHSLMRKMLLQLVSEIRKLGATVVAADFSSIIIATGKHNLTAAVGSASIPIPYNLYFDPGPGMCRDCEHTQTLNTTCEISPPPTWILQMSDVVAVSSMVAMQK